MHCMVMYCIASFCNAYCTVRWLWRLLVRYRPCSARQKVLTWSHPLMKTTVLFVPFIPLCFVPGFTTTQWTQVSSTQCTFQTSTHYGTSVYTTVIAHLSCMALTISIWEVLSGRYDVHGCISS